MFYSQSALPSIPAWECVYIFAVSGALTVSSGLSIKVDYLCVSLHLFHPASEAAENLVLLLDGMFEAVRASTRGSLSETLENLSGGRRWGEIDKASKRLRIPITSPLLTVSSSLQLGKDGADGRDGRASAVELVKQHQLEIKLWKGTKTRVCGVNECVQLRVCVDFCPCGSWKDKGGGGMISTRWPRRGEKTRSHVGWFYFSLSEHAASQTDHWIDLSGTCL